MTLATVAALLRVARDLTAQDRFDVEVAQRLLGNLPRDDLDVQTLGAVIHARRVVSVAADQSEQHISIARSAFPSGHKGRSVSRSGDRTSSRLPQSNIRFRCKNMRRAKTG